jgi:hypothetical protein
MKPIALLLFGPFLTLAADAPPIVIDFENATVFLESAKSNRVEQVVEKGVVFKLAHEPRKSKGKGLLSYFVHIPSGHKGLVSAMALEAIPVQASFPKPVAAVTVAAWGSTATPAILEAFDTDGKLVDRAKLDAAPNRKAPGDPAPIFQLSVKGPRIAYVQWSGPRPGEYLAVDEVRFVPLTAGEDAAQHR